MAKGSSTAHPKRRKYLVTLICNDGRKPQWTVWAESPEHAIRKAEAKFSWPLSIVVGKMAEVIK